MTKSRLYPALAATLCIALGFIPSAHAQSFPSKAVRVVVPFPAGGTLDSLGRQLATRMQESLGQPVVIEPRGGGATRVGTQAVQSSAPDGHTVLFMANSFVMVPMLMEKAPWDPLKDFAPVSLVSRVSQVLVVHPSFEARTLSELVKFAKAKPGQIDFASFGNGTSSHLGVELFKSMANVFMVHIPYAGVAPALQNVLGGQVKVFFTNIPDVLPHIQAGRLHALATSDDKRSPLLPAVPTFAEQGYKDQIYTITGSISLMAPAKTPDDIIERLGREVVAVIKQPGVRKRIEELGLEPVGNTPAEATAAYKAFLPVALQLAKDTGVTLD